MKDKSIVYIPSGAKINRENKHMDEPKTKYENRKRVIDLEKAKKVIGGIYGRFAKHKDS